MKKISCSVVELIRNWRSTTTTTPNATHRSDKNKQKFLKKICNRFVCFARLQNPNRPNRPKKTETNEIYTNLVMLICQWQQQHKRNASAARKHTIHTQHGHTHSCAHGSTNMTSYEVVCARDWTCAVTWARKMHANGLPCGTTTYVCDSAGLLWMRLFSTRCPKVSISSPFGCFEWCVPIRYFALCSIAIRYNNTLCERREQHKLNMQKFCGCGIRMWYCKILCRVALIIPWVIFIRTQSGSIKWNCMSEKCVERE